MSVYSLSARISIALDRQIKKILVLWSARKNLLPDMHTKIALLSCTVKICADNITAHLFCLCRAALKHRK